jgi:ABC-2 type transport system ATP-binding protein
MGLKKVVEMKGVRKTFVSGWVHRVRKQALKGIDFEVPEGVLWGILGPNGAGKTTLLSILANLLKPEEGFVRERIFGSDLWKFAAGSISPPGMPIFYGA